MIRYILGSCALAIGLAAGPALADCKAEIEAFDQGHGQALAKEIEGNSEVGRAVENLREAALLLGSAGDQDGCEALLVTLVYLADDYAGGGADGAKAEQSEGEQAEGEQAKAEQAEGEQSEAEQAKAEQSEGEQAKAEQSEAEGEQAEAEQGQAEQTEVQQAQAQEEEAEGQTGQQAATGEDAAAQEGAAEVVVDQQAQEIADRTVAFDSLDTRFDAARLLEREVRNYEDTVLGKVDGVLVSTESGLSHVLVEQGGFLGIGEKKIAIPVTSLRWNPEEEVFYLNLGEEQLGNAPEYDTKNEWVAEINDRWYDDPS